MVKLFTVLINIPVCHTYNYSFNVIRYLCFCKQKVYKVAAGTFLLIECSRLKQLPVLLNEL